MERESEYWEKRYQAQDTQWDKGCAHPEIVKWIGGQKDLGHVLVPGCGRGHDVRAIAGKATEVIGLDFAQTAIDEAQQFPRTGGERYVVGDFFETDPNWAGYFDWIVEHTLFCAIPIDRRVDYVESCSRLLHTHGKLFAIFFLDPGISLEEGPPFGISLNEVHSLFSGRFMMLESWIPRNTFPDRTPGELAMVLQKCDDGVF